MVETDSTGRTFPGWGKVPEDIIPKTDETYDLGTANKRWAYLYAVIAILTSMVIGGIYLGATTEGYFLINATTQINGSLNVNENITASNITADYYFGNGSQLTDITLTETDPYWSANYTALNDTWSSTYNATYDAKVSFPGWDANLAWENQTNIFTANQNLTGQNITAIDCIIFDSGGRICSGV